MVPAVGRLSVALMLIFDCVLLYNFPPNTQELGYSFAF